MSVDLYIVRHGNTFDPGDIVRRVGARTDLPLSSSGLQQAEALSKHFIDLGLSFKAAYSSLLLRTRQTMDAILHHQPSAGTTHFLDFLREIDYGPDEGKPENEVMDRIGETALAAWEAEAKVPDGWQVDPEALRLAWAEFFASLSQSQQDGPVIAVTSNGIARFALQLALKAQTADHALKLKTGAYGVLRLSGKTDVSVITWNRRP